MIWIFNPRFQETTKRHRKAYEYKSTACNYNQYSKITNAYLHYVAVVKIFCLCWNSLKMVSPQCNNSRVPSVIGTRGRCFTLRTEYRDAEQHQMKGCDTCMSKNNRSSRRISNALAGIGTFAVLACVAFIGGHYIFNHQAAPTTMASHGGPNTTSNVMGTNNSIQGVSNTTQVSTPESQSSTNVASISSNGYSSIASAAVKVHSYTAIIQAANAINTIQQGFGQYQWL